MKMVNTRLLGHPLNWLVVWSMLFIMFYLGHLLISFFTGQHPGTIPVSGTYEGVAGPGTDDPQAISA